MLKRIFNIALFSIFILSTALSVHAFADEKVVAEGKAVKLDYVLKVDGKEFETTKGRKPLEYVVGSGHMIKGFEDGIMGMKVGEKRTFTVKPEDAYGFEDPEAYKEMPKTAIPKGPNVKEGTLLYYKDKNGNTRAATVGAIKNDTVVINFNHPLAGKTLQFEVEILDIGDVAPPTVLAPAQAAPQATKEGAKGTAAADKPAKSSDAPDKPAENK